MGKMKSFSRFQYSTVLLPVSVAEKENSELLSHLCFIIRFQRSKQVEILR